MQLQSNVVLAQLLDRALGHLHFRTRHFHAGFLETGGNLRRAHRTVQLAHRAGVGDDGERQHCLHLRRPRRGGGHAFPFHCHQLGASFFECGDLLFGGGRRLALRQQVVAPVARAHVHDVPDTAEALDTFQENDPHDGSTSAGQCKAAGRDSGPASRPARAASDISLRFRWCGPE